MNRETLLQQIREYKAFDAEEEGFRTRTLHLLEQEPDCFQRKLLHGHITGSAWVVSPDGENVLLLHHRKLDKWLQPGGHADGDENVRRVAQKEAEEESGLQDIRLYESGIFDLDIHTIPERKGVPEHLHYDIRFRFVANPAAPLQQNSESKGLAWVPLKEVPARTDQNRSILRMLQKTSRQTLTSRSNIQ